MKSTTALHRFMTAWQNHDAETMNKLSLQQMQSQSNIDRFNGWFDALPKINFEVKEEVANFDGILADVQVVINDKLFQFRLMRQSGKFKADAKKGRWRLNPGSMRKVNENLHS